MKHFVQTPLSHRGDWRLFSTRSFRYSHSRPTSELGLKVIQGQQRTGVKCACVKSGLNYSWHGTLLAEMDTTRWVFYYLWYGHPRFLVLYKCMTSNLSKYMCKTWSFFTCMSKAQCICSITCPKWVFGQCVCRPCDHEHSTNSIEVFEVLLGDMEDTFMFCFQCQTGWIPLWALTDCYLNNESEADTSNLCLE